MKCHSNLIDFHFIIFRRKSEPSPAATTEKTPISTLDKTHNNFYGEFRFEVDQQTA